MIEWTGLEIRRTALPYRGFESHSFRNKNRKTQIQINLICVFLFLLQGRSRQRSGWAQANPFTNFISIES